MNSLSVLVYLRRGSRSGVPVLLLVSQTKKVMWSTWLCWVSCDHLLLSPHKIKLFTAHIPPGVNT